MNDSQIPGERPDPPDYGRAVSDSRDWPGLALTGAAVALIAIAIAAAASGMQAWSRLAGGAALVCFVAGVVILALALRRRTRRTRWGHTGGGGPARGRPRRGPAAHGG